MKQAVIVDAARTPIGKASAEAGYFRDVRADELSASLLQAIVQRTGIDPRLIEDVRWGCVQQQGEQGYDVGRIAVLMADLPVTVAGVTINRNCGSALQAINDAAMSIMSGCEDVQIAGGVEHMDHIPANKDYDPAPSLFRKHSEAIMNMGLTAEYLAMKYGISRQRQDEFAARSQQSACEATRKGEFAAEIVPTWGRNEIGLKALITTDQGLRSDTTVEGLSKLPPAFNPAGGSVTAGNASQVSVGAAASLIMSEDKARELGLKPLAKIRSMAVVGVAPEEMGIGPAPAIQKALQRAGLKLSDIDCIEVNEAFAVQVLSVLKLLGIDETKVNTRGGAIAIGHPLGASGARVVATLLHRMRDSGAKYGIASLCIGQGQGIATVFEACGV
ncbi:MAG: acetyl-CoA C-acyltransferase [Planctomycetia bacterium]|nr:acetyl-CoA C-acyltransferase [Planctomycetia bacterium]